MKKIVIIDDDRLFLEVLSTYITENFPVLELCACDDPIRGLALITNDLDLLLIDLEMPGMDGTKLLAYARSMGISKDRIIILSARDAEYLHELFPMGVCLAVLNKHEARQKVVLDMVFKALQDKA